jgi:hypothetical protein
MKTITIKDLRYAGYKVRVLHTRPVTYQCKLDGKVPIVSAKGGTTVIEITTPDGSKTVVGKAECSLKDVWNRKLGNKIALNRALVELDTESLFQN